MTTKKNINFMKYLSVLFFLSIMGTVCFAQFVDTQESDFGKFNESFGVNLTSHSIYLQRHSGVTISTWPQTSPVGYNYPTSGGCVVWNKRIYSMGGWSGSLVSNVSFANINDDGTLSAWFVTTSLPNGLRLFAAVVYNGRIYITGGDVGTSTKTVIVSDINPSDGQLGQWSYATSLPDARYNHSAVVYNGRIYIIGGDGTNWNQILGADINPDGGLSSWSVAGTFPYGTSSVQGPNAFVWNGKLYITGGNIDGSAYSNNVRYATINPDGTLSSFSVGTSMLLPLAYHGAIATGGKIYILGGYTTGTSTGNVTMVQINSDGSIGTWNTINSLPQKRYAGGYGIWNDYVYLVGGYVDGSNSDTVIYNKLGVDSNQTGNTWRGGSDNISNHYGDGFVSYKNNIYRFGGGGGTNFVYRCPVSKSIGASNMWLTENEQLLVSIDYPAVSRYNERVFVVGGKSTSAVQAATISSDGTLSAFAHTLGLPQIMQMGGAVIAERAGLYRNIYMIGGNNSASIVFSSVGVGAIDSNGNITSWNFSPANYLPGRRNGFGCVTWKDGNDVDYIYVICGSSESSSGFQVASKANNTVYYSSITLSGNIAEWKTTTAAFPVALDSIMSAIDDNGYIYVAGGENTGGTVQSSVYRGKIQSGGDITSWLPIANLPVVQYAGGGTYNTNGWVIVSGGNLSAEHRKYFLALSTGIPQGTFTKNIDLQGRKWLTTFNWTNGNTYGDASSEYRVALESASAQWQGWTNIASGGSINKEARHFQYRVTLTSSVSNPDYIREVVDFTLNYTSPPAAPVLNDVNPIFISSITVSLKDKSINETSFYIYADITPATTTQVREINSTTAGSIDTDYIDTLPSLSANTTYYIRTRAWTTNIFSDFSSVIATVTLCNAPVFSSFSNISTGSIRVNWTDNTSGAVYIVERSTWDGFSGTVETKNVNDPTLYADFTSLSPNTTYWFRVNARNYRGTLTAWSSTASTATLANIPSALTVTSIDDISMSISVNANNNPSNTLYSIIIDTFTDGTAGGGLAFNSTGYLRVC